MIREAMSGQTPTDPWASVKSLPAEWAHMLDGQTPIYVAAAVDAARAADAETITQFQEESATLKAQVEAWQQAASEGPQASIFAELLTMDDECKKLETELATLRTESDRRVREAFGVELEHRAQLWLDQCMLAKGGRFCREEVAGGSAVARAIHRIQGACSGDSLIAQVADFAAFLAQRQEPNK